MRPLEGHSTTTVVPGEARQVYTGDEDEQPDPLPN